MPAHVQLPPPRPPRPAAGLTSGALVLDEDLPAWSLPRTAVDGIVLENLLPERVDRDWALAGATGRGVKVCVLDSGVELDHPSVGEVAGAVFITLDENGDPVAEEDHEGDLCGHGTACAGVIRALAPEAEIYSVRVLGAGFKGSGGFSSPACAGPSSRATTSST